jgi:4-carboxymuconolactone decarboxylase
VEWTTAERAIIDATDQLYVDCDLDDDVWSRLSDNFNVKEIVELIMVVGKYRMLAGFMKGARLQPEERP